jgi:hypothetical protein
LQGEEAATLGLCLETDENTNKAFDYELFLIHERNRSTRRFQEAPGVENEEPASGRFLKLLAVQ